MTITDALIWKRHLAIKKGDDKEVEKLDKKLREADCEVTTHNGFYRATIISNPRSSVVLDIDFMEKRFKNVK